LPKRNDYEIGYYVSSDYKNLGIATSAVDFITNEIIFKEFNCEKIYGIIFKDNIGSEKVLRKSGFEFVGGIEGGLEKNREKKDLKCFLKIKKMQ
ncbi:13990_t:CDS:1, partial [Entrophospora sp. SA101]